MDNILAFGASILYGAWDQEGGWVNRLRKCVDEGKVNPIPWSPECSYKNEYIEKYNQVMKSVAEENKIYFIDIYKEFSGMDYKKLLEDGVHPNSEGHKIMFEIIKEFLIENKLI